MSRLFKHKCSRCKKNYVIVTWKNKYPQCYDCQKQQLSREIKDAKMKKFFDIPEEFYRQNAFLRDIKIGYLEYGRLSDLQKDMFLKSVEKMKKMKDEPVSEPKMEDVY